MKDIHRRFQKMDCYFYGGNMGGSIFKNFDPECGDFGPDSLFADTAGITALIFKGMEACAQPTLTAGPPTKHFLTNDEYGALARRAEELAKIGYAERKSAPWIPHDDLPVVEYGDFLPIDWACFGWSCVAEKDVYFAQVVGIYALQQIDYVLSCVKEKGWWAGTVEKLLLATSLVAFAADGENSVKIKSLLRHQMSARGKAGAAKAHAKKKKMRDEAIRLYEERKGNAEKATLQIAKEIVPLVQKYGQEEAKHQLSPDRVEKTIYGWLLTYKNNN